MKEHIRIFAERKKVVVFCLVIGIITGFFEFAGLVLDELPNGITRQVILKDVLYFFLCSVFFFLLYYFRDIIMKALCFGRQKISDSPLSRLSSTDILTNRIAVFCFIFILWIPCFLAYFPAIYSYDAEPQLIQYTMHQFDNHHPIFHTLILGWCYDLGRMLKVDGMAFYSIIQMILLDVSFTEVVITMRRKGVRKLFCAVILIYFAVFPVHPLMAISTTKDTPFTAFIILTVVLLWRIMTSHEGQTNMLLPAEHAHMTLRTELTLMSLSMMGMMLFRRNGVHIAGGVVIASILSHALNSKKEFRDKYLHIALYSLAGIAAFMLVNTTLINITHAAAGEEAEALSIPIQQLARTYKSNSSTMTEEEKQELYKYLPEIALQNYRPSISDGAKQNFNNEAYREDPKGFFKIWGHLLKKYPGSYALATLYNTEGDWFPTDVSFSRVYKDIWRDRTGYLITDATPVFCGMDYVHKENLLPKLRDRYEAFATGCDYSSSFLLTLMFSPAMYCLFVVYIFVWCLFLSDEKNLTIVIVPLLLNFLTILAGPCMLVRYVYPLMCSSPILWVIFVSRKEGTAEKALQGTSEENSGVNAKIS